MAACLDARLILQDSERLLQEVLANQNGGRPCSAAFTGSPAACSAAEPSGESTISFPNAERLQLLDENALSDILEKVCGRHSDRGTHMASKASWAG